MPKFRIRENLRNLDHMSLGVVIFAGASGISTAAGIFSLFTAPMTALVGDTIGITLSTIIAVAVSLGIQLFLIGAWTQFAHAPSKNWMELTLGVVMSLVSCLGGAAGWHLGSTADQMLANKSEVAATELAAPLANYSQDYGETVGGIKALEIVVNGKMENEEKYGGTCSVQLVPTCESACRLRKSQALRLKSAAETASAYGTEVRQAATSIVSAGDLEGQREAFDMAAQLGTSDVPTSVSNVLDQIATELSGEAIWRDPETGSKVSCPDPTIANRAKMLAKKLAERPTLGLAVPKEPSVNVADSSGCILNQIGTIWDEKAIGCQSANPPMALQGVLELLLALMLVHGGIRQRRLNLVPSERERAGFPKSMDPGSPFAVTIAREVVATMRTHVIVASKVQYLIAEPQVENCPGTLLAEDYLEIDAPTYSRVALNSLDSFFQRFGSTHVDIFVLDEDAKSKLRLARACLREATLRARRQEVEAEDGSEGDTSPDAAWPEDLEVPDADAFYGDAGDAGGGLDGGDVDDGNDHNSARDQP